MANHTIVLDDLQERALVVRALSNGVTPDQFAQSLIAIGLAPTVQQIRHTDDTALVEALKSDATLLASVVIKAEQIAADRASLAGEVTIADDKPVA